MRWRRMGRDEKEEGKGRGSLLLLMFADEEEEVEEEEEEEEEEEVGGVAAAVMRREDIHLGECMGTGSGIGARKVCPKISTSPLSTRTPTLPTKQQDSPACFFQRTESKRMGEEVREGGREGGRAGRALSVHTSMPRYTPPCCFFFSGSRHDRRRL